MSVRNLMTSMMVTMCAIYAMLVNLNALVVITVKFPVLIIYALFSDDGVPDAFQDPSNKKLVPVFYGKGSFTEYNLV